MLHDYLHIFASSGPSEQRSLALGLGGRLKSETVMRQGLASHPKSCLHSRMFVNGFLFFFFLREDAQSPVQGLSLSIVAKRNAG